MMNDPIGDFLTRIRNAHQSRHKTVSCFASKMKVHIAEILKNEGYIADFAVEGEVPKRSLTLSLKYDSERKPVIEGLKRVSKPGLRIYSNVDKLPQVRGGFGMAVVSTSRGLMSDSQARRDNLGGEVLCYVW
jgi:small subunit ribosomal protein S8